MRATWVLILLISHSLSSQVALPLPLGHSHNDYEQARPLLDAIELGFTSIEADIHPFFGQLKVAHDKKKLWQKPTLQKLYIKPLDSLVTLHGGTVFPDDSTTVVLMIDLKTKKEVALRRLHRITKRYEHLFYKRQENDDVWGPVKIVISGDPPPNQIERLKNPYLFIDGRLTEEYPSFMKNMVCRISANYHSLVSAIDDKKLFEELSTTVKACTENGRNFRFWATKDKPDMWSYLRELGVSWIGVDDLPAFASYIRNIEQSTTSSK